MLGSGNVGVIIECQTDNTNRTVRSVRQILSQYNGQIAPVQYLFVKAGRVQVSLPPNMSKDEREALIEEICYIACSFTGGDFRTSEDSDIVELICSPAELERMTSKVSETPNLEIFSNEWIYQARDATEEPDVAVDETVSRLVGELEDNEDCIRIWTTIDHRIRRLDAR